MNSELKTQSSTQATHSAERETTRAVAGRVAFDLQLMLLIALLPFVVFWREALGLRVFYHHDLQYYFYPYHKVAVDITTNGHLPLWNPYAFSGIPLLGDGQTAMFYPPNWLFWLLPSAHALTVVVLLQFSIAGVGAYLYVRALRLSRLAAFVAALAFMFNGFLVARVVHLSIMAGAALIPLCFWATEQLLQRANARSFVVAAVIVGVQALAGHPQIPIYTAVALGCYVLMVAGRRWWTSRTWRAWSPLPQLAAVYVAGYALAAIQLVPWIEFASFSPRAAGASYEFVTYHSLSAFDWLLFLFPYGYGGLTASWLQSTPPWDLPVYMWERLPYVGLFPLALAVVGRVELRRLSRQRDSNIAAVLQHDRLWALLVVLVVTLLIAAGSSTPVGRLIYALPVIGKLRAYARAIALVCFVIPVLAAYGIDRLQAHRPRAMSRRVDRAPIVAAVLLVLLVDGVLLLANGLGSAGLIAPSAEPMFKVMLDRSLRLWQANAVVPLALAGASAAVLFWLSRGVTQRNVAAMLGVLALDIVGFATTFNPRTDSAVFDREPASVAFLRSDKSLFRTASFISVDRLPVEAAQSQLAISWAIPYGIEDINGFNSLQPRRYTDFLFGPQVEDVSYGFLRDPALLESDNRVLSLLNVKYALVQPQSQVMRPEPWAGPLFRDPEEMQRRKWRKVFEDEHVTIYRNPVPLDRAYFVDQVAVVPDAQTILQAVKLRGFDPRQLSLVEGGLTQATAQRLSQPGAATVRVERVSPNELHLHTQTDRERFLVLSEMWFPGWHAEVDGRELPIFRTNYLFRGLVAPAGEHTIRMYYRPNSALIGAGVTAATMTALIAALVWQRERAKRPKLFGVISFR